MKNTINTHPQTKLTAKIKTELERKIKTLYVNKDLIDYFQVKIPNNATERLAYLHYFKKLVQQVYRSPDPDHYKAFEEEYEAERIAIAEEQKFRDPVRWLNVEIEYLLNISTSSPEKLINEQQSAIQQAEAQFNKAWLTKAQIMQLLKISKSTLNRWISQGMPCHKKGKSLYFNHDDINQYLRD